MVKLKYHHCARRLWNYYWSLGLDDPIPMWLLQRVNEGFEIKRDIWRK